MNKLSRYNLVISYENFKLMYNTLCNSLVCYTLSEYEVIKELLGCLALFEKEYPTLFYGLKSAGFIVDEGNDELEMVRSANRRIVFDKEYCHLTVNPTLDCNLTCWYCSTEYAKAAHCGRMSDETVEKVKRHISYLIEQQRIKRFHLDWFGGEPLMYFNEVVDPISSFAVNLCMKYDVRFTQHVTSNSTLITEEMAERMRELKFTSFQITLDGNEEHHNKIKFFADKSGTYRNVIYSINTVCEKIPSACVILRINFDKKTLSDIQSIVQDIKSQVRKQIVVDFQKVWQVRWNKKDDVKLKTVKHFFAENGLHSNYWAYSPQRFIKCYADRRGHYVVNYNGEIFKCTARDYGKDKIIGTLNEDGTVTWNEQLLSGLLDKAPYENEKCLGCNILPLCMGPCTTNSAEARLANRNPPCMLDHVQYSLDDFVIEEAYKRNLIHSY